MRRPLPILVAVLVLATTSGTFAQGLSVSLPLQGYYRPGECMPVRLTSPAGKAQPIDSMLTLQAEGAVPTQIHVAMTAPDGVYPWLIYGQPRDPALVNAGVSRPLSLDLRPVPPKTRLVGFAVPGDEVVRLMFPGETIVPIPLDPNDPLPGPLAAWEALDAVVLDEKWLASHGDTPNGLLAHGTAVILRGDDRPASNLPWHRVDRYWVVLHDVAGPTGVIAPEAYLPVEGWTPGRTWELRKQTLIRGVLFALLATGLALWRPRAAPVTVGALVVLFVVAANYWTALYPADVRARAAVEVQGADGGPAQRDSWTYVWASKPYAGEDAGVPVFASASHLRRSGLSLSLPAGAAYFGYRYQLPRGAKLAIRSTLVYPGLPAPASTDPPDSPIMPLVERAYLRAGQTRYWGQRPANADVEALPDWTRMGHERWPDVVLKRTSSSSSPGAPARAR